MSGPWYQMPPRRAQAASGGRPALILIIYIGGRATAKIKLLIERDNEIARFLPGSTRFRQEANFQKCPFRLSQTPKSDPVPIRFHPVPTIPQSQKWRFCLRGTTKSARFPPGSTRFRPHPRRPRSFGCFVASTRAITCLQVTWQRKLPRLFWCHRGAMCFAQSGSEVWFPCVTHSLGSPRSRGSVIFKGGTQHPSTTTSTLWRHLSGTIAKSACNGSIASAMLKASTESSQSESKSSWTALANVCLIDRRKMLQTTIHHRIIPVFSIFKPQM